MATRRRSGTQGTTTQGPWVQVAAFCDQVVIDKTETLTLVRVIDQVTLIPPRRQAAPHRRWVGGFALALKAGDVYGAGEIVLVMMRPNGKRTTVGRISVAFDDAIRAVNIAQRVQLRFDEEGLHWLDVSYAGRLVTRMPLTVRYRPAPTPEQDRLSSASPQ